MIILPAIFKIKPGENHKTVAHTQKPFLQHLTTFCAIRFHRVVREFRGPLRGFSSPLSSSWQVTFKFRYTLLADVLPSKSIHHTWLTGQMMYAGFPNEKLRFACQAGQYEHLRESQMPVLAYLNFQGSFSWWVVRPRSRLLSVWAEKKQEPERSKAHCYVQALDNMMLTVLPWSNTEN